MRFRHVSGKCNGEPPEFWCWIMSQCLDRDDACAHISRRENSPLERASLCRAAGVDFLFSGSFLDLYNSTGVWSRRVLGCMIVCLLGSSLWRRARPSSALTYCDVTRFPSRLKLCACSVWSVAQNGFAFVWKDSLSGLPPLQDAQLRVTSRSQEPTLGAMITSC